MDVEGYEIIETLNDEGPMDESDLLDTVAERDGCEGWSRQDIKNRLVKLMNERWVALVNSQWMLTTKGEEAMERWMDDGDLANLKL